MKRFALIINVSDDKKIWATVESPELSGEEYCNVLAYALMSVNQSIESTRKCCPELAAALDDAIEEWRGRGFPDGSIVGVKSRLNDDPTGVTGVV